ncbi:MAG: lipid A deacylase LpxR family protein, partial [Rhodospirillaceae bacterium]
MRACVTGFLSAVAFGLASLHGAGAGEVVREPARNAVSKADTEVAPEFAKAGGTELGTFTLQFENDLFAGTDRNYTNGVRLSWLSPEGGKTLPILQYGRDLLAKIARDENRKTRFGWALGQEIYTPGDRHATAVIPDDRPYAGWLYGALSLHSVIEGEKGARTSESVELRLGIVGPEALGEQAQDFVHSVRLIEKFDGWDNQLGSEPGILIAYERRWRFAKPWDIGGGVQWDFVPHAGA